MARTAGDRINQYQIREKLGEGGMGEVFLATDTRLGRDVALKFIPESVCCDDDARERLLSGIASCDEAPRARNMQLHNISGAPASPRGGWLRRQPDPRDGFFRQAHAG